MKKPQQFLLAQRACMEGYPPTLNQAALLGQNSKIVALDALTERESAASLMAPAAERVRVVRKAASSRAMGIFHRLDWAMRFYREFRRQMRRRPRTIIAYDPEAAFFLLKFKPRSSRSLSIVHLHEMTVPEDVASTVVGSFALRSTLKNLHRADLVVMPDRARAEWVQKALQLPETPMVVMNCPRLLPALPQSRLLPFLRERGVSTSRIVHYQGAVGSHHFFEPIIRSMRFWPSDAVFVIVGQAREDYQRELEALAEGEGVAERLIFVGRVPYDQVFSYAVGAAVGVSFLDGKYLQWQLSAGASNKRFEYITLGIPQVTNDLVGVRELFEQTGVAAIADENDIADIGAKISVYLEDETLRVQVSQKARALHLESYNYETQMQPLIKWIERNAIKTA